MESLHSAGNELRSALDRYIDVCSRVQDHCSLSGISNVPEIRLHQIRTEMAHFSSYAPKLKEAEVAISRTYNSVTQFVPVNCLPPEIMAHVFHLVLASEPCNLRLLTGTECFPEMPRKRTHCRVENFPMYPDYLAHVCTRWRQIALASPSLWSHIDFTPDDKIHVGMLARAKTHQGRACALPLVLHIYEDAQINWDKDSLKGFLASVAGRTKILDFTVIKNLGHFTSTFLGGLLAGRAPESSKLTQLAITFTGNRHSPHFGSTSGSRNDGSLRLDVPHSVLEDSFRRLSVLHSRGLFPFWSSAAYDNLVDLRLLAASDDHWNSIPESYFRAILKRSPRLRVLYFALEIRDRTPQSTLLAPVLLEQLEFVSIASYRNFNEQLLEPGDVLRHLAPGVRPLQLSIWHLHYHNEGDFSLSELERFFKRANITKFNSKYGCPPLRGLRYHAPNLTDLALDCDEVPLDPTNPEESQGGSILTLQLNTLILHGWQTPASDELNLFLQLYPTKKIIFLNRFLTAKSAKEIVQEEHPDIEVFVYDTGGELSDPLANWDVFSLDYSKLTPR